MQIKLMSYNFNLNVYMIFLLFQLFPHDPAYTNSSSFSKAYRDWEYGNAKARGG